MQCRTIAITAMSTTGAGGEVIPFEVVVTMNEILVEDMVMRVVLRPVVTMSVLNAMTTDNLTHNAEVTTDEMT